MPKGSRRLTRTYSFSAKRVRLTCPSYCTRQKAAVTQQSCDSVLHFEPIGFSALAGPAGASLGFEVCDGPKGHFLAPVGGSTLRLQPALSYYLRLRTLQNRRCMATLHRQTRR